MEKAREIEHLGVIESITESTVKVSFLQEAACETCQVKGACSVPDQNEQEVEITDYSGKYAVGEHVNVVLAQSLGIRALFLGYVLPFIIVFAVLVVASVLLNNELFAGLIALFCLIPYYLSLYYSRDKLKKTFSFTIRKLA